jgi:hypothetical protein
LHITLKQVCCDTCLDIHHLRSTLFILRQKVGRKVKCVLFCGKEHHRYSKSNYKWTKQLYLAADLLHRHFSTILMLNCFMAFITMFIYAYYVIEFIQSGLSMIVVFWDSSDVIESFVRFWLICHTSDRIREAVIIIKIKKKIIFYWISSV